MARVADGGAGPRPYDATERRRLAERQRLETRRRIAAAARQRFLEEGYTATTIAEVARTAGVAVQTIYSAVGGKADLLVEVVSRTIAGDDRDVMLLDREWMTALRAEPDPRRQVGIFADEMTAIGARVVPLFLMMRAAAASDPEVAAAYQRSAELRWQTMRAVVSALHGVRPGLRGDRAANLVLGDRQPGDVRPAGAPARLVTGRLRGLGRWCHRGRPIRQARPGAMTPARLAKDRPAQKG